MVETSIKNSKSVIKQGENDKVIQDEFCLNFEPKIYDYNLAVKVFWGRLSKIILGIDGEGSNFKRLVKAIRCKMKEIKEGPEKYDWKKTFGSLIGGITPKKSVGFAQSPIMGSCNIAKTGELKSKSNSNSRLVSVQHSEAPSPSHSINVEKEGP